MKGILNKLKGSALKDNFLSLMGNGSNAVLSFLIFLVMSRTLEKEIFGVWILFITTATTLDMLRFGFTRPGMVYYLSSEKQDKKAIVGAAYKIELVIYLALAAVFVASYFIVKELYPASPYLAVLLYYPVLGLVNLPWNMALPYLNATKKYGHILRIRLLFSGLVLASVILYFFKFTVKVEGIIIIYIAANFVSSIYIFAKKWSGITDMFVPSKDYVKKLNGYGKYSIGTFIGASLLSSADTFILSASIFMGPASIAIYAIPLKFIEIIEIPLRSFSYTLMPLLAQYGKNQITNFKETLYKYIGINTLLFFGIGLGCAVLSIPFLKLFGGSQYSDVLKMQQLVLLIVIINGIMLPFNRYTGVALDSLKRPELNFYKILIMLGANIIGDLIAVFVFKSLPLVALSTFVFTVIGVWYAWYQLNKLISINTKDLIRVCKIELQQSIKKLRSSI